MHDLTKGTQVMRRAYLGFATARTLLFGTMLFNLVIWNSNLAQTMAYGSSSVAKVRQLINDDRDDSIIQLTQPVETRLKFLLSRSGRVDDLKQRLRRMKKYQSMIFKKLARHNLPKEIAAIPFVETGYRNLSPRKTGTGLWMFTTTTARAYQLEIEPKQDERMDPAKATEAAIRLLQDYHNRFDNWHLAIAAYNQGPSRVKRAMKKAGTDNVWELIEQGHLNKYVAHVVAAAIIIKHHKKLIPN